MYRLTLAALAVLAFATPALAQPIAGAPPSIAGPVTRFDQTIGTTPVLIWSQDTPHLFARLANPAAAGGGTSYCNFLPPGTTSPAGVSPNAPGTIALPPGSLEQFPDAGHFLPNNPLGCVATAAGTPLTAEAR